MLSAPKSPKDATSEFTRVMPSERNKRKNLLINFLFKHHSNLVKQEVRMEQITKVFWASLVDCIFTKKGARSSNLFNFISYDKSVSATSVYS